MDVWTDAGFGSFEPRCLRDKEKREVDFAVIRDDTVWFLVEVKLSDPGLTGSLEHFQGQTDAEHAFHVVVLLPPVPTWGETPPRPLRRRLRQPRAPRRVPANPRRARSPPVGPFPEVPVTPPCPSDSSPAFFGNKRNATHNDILFTPAKTLDVELKRVTTPRGGTGTVILEGCEPAEFVSQLL